MGKNETFHIHVKNEHGYSRKYPEHVFSVIGLSLCRRCHYHKMRQITKCDGKDSWIVAICDCRILWRFKMQLLRFMSVVQEGILLSTGNMYTSMSHWNNAKMGKNETFHIHVKSEHGYSPKYPEHVFSVTGLSLCRHGHDHKMRQITKCDGKDSWIVVICGCRIMWRFQMQLLRFMSVVLEGILLSAGNMYTSTSDTINKVSFANRLWAL